MIRAADLERAPADLVSHTSRIGRPTASPATLGGTGLSGPASSGDPPRPVRCASPAPLIGAIISPAYPAGE